MTAFGDRRNNLVPNNNNNRKKVACRLCERVLNNTQALISHIESHIVHDEISPINRKNQHNHYQQQQNIIPMRNNNIQPNNQFIFPNPNIAPRFAPSPAPPPPVQMQTQRPHFFVPNGGAGPARAVLQRPVPLRGHNLSLTLGGARGPHFVKINRSQPLISRDLAARKGGFLGRFLNRRPRWNVAEEKEEVGPNGGTRPFLSQLDYPIPTIVDLEMEYEDGLDLTLKL